MATESAVLLELLVSCDGGRGPTHTHAYVHTQPNKDLKWEDVLCLLTLSLEKFSVSVILSWGTRDIHSLVNPYKLSLVQTGTQCQISNLLAGFTMVCLESPCHSTSLPECIRRRRSGAGGGQLRILLGDSLSLTLSWVVNNDPTLQNQKARIYFAQNKCSVSEEQGWEVGCMLAGKASRDVCSHKAAFKRCYGIS